MSKFEPGQQVRLRSGGIRMVVKQPAHAGQLPDSPLVHCEYQAKHRTVQGFFAEATLVRVGTAPQGGSDCQERPES